MFSYLISRSTGCGAPASDAGAEIWSAAFHNFERAMGVAARGDRLAVGSQRQVWFLNAAPEIAPRLPPAGQYDGCFLARTALYTGEIQVHELAFGGAEGANSGAPTRCSPVCARWMSVIASSRAGGRSSFRRWRRRIVVTSTALRWGTIASRLMRR